MGFSLDSLDRSGKQSEDYERLSYTVSAMTALRKVIRAADLPRRTDEGEVLWTLSVNDELVVTPAQSSWLAERLRNADREKIQADDPEPEELLAMVDELAAFCVRCARSGGFRVT